MESLATAFAVSLGKYVSKEIVVFIISMIPILELRGGLIVASLLKVPITTAIPLCVPALISRSGMVCVTGSASFRKPRSIPKH